MVLATSVVVGWIQKKVSIKKASRMLIINLLYRSLYNVGDFLPETNTVNPTNGKDSILWKCLITMAG